MGLDKATRYTDSNPNAELSARFGSLEAALKALKTQDAQNERLLMGLKPGTVGTDCAYDAAIKKTIHILEYIVRYANKGSRAYRSAFERLEVLGCTSRSFK